MNSTGAIVLGVSACILLAGSIVFGRQQVRELAGIHGLPVEGHDTVASVEIAGTKQIHLHKIHERFAQTARTCGWGCRLNPKRSVASKKSFET